MTEKDDLPVFDAARKWLDRYFNREQTAISELPLAPIGGEFLQSVWQILCKIPYGMVMTYVEITKIVAANLNNHRRFLHFEMSFDAPN